MWWRGCWRIRSGKVGRGSGRRRWPIWTAPRWIRCLPRTPLIRRAALPELSPQGAEHLQHLFALTGASHLMAVGRAPLRLLALAVPPLALTARVSAELAAVQRIAMAEGQDGQGGV